MWERSLRWRQDILIDLRDLELRKTYESGDSALGAATGECLSAEREERTAWWGNTAKKEGKSVQNTEEV